MATAVRSYRLSTCRCLFNIFCDLRFFLFRGLSRASAYADAWHWSYSIQDARWALCCSIYLVVKWESWVSPWSVCDHLGCRLRLAGGAEYSRWITGKEHFAFVHFDTKGQRYRWSFVCSWKKPWRSGNTLVNLFLNFFNLNFDKSKVLLFLSFVLTAKPSKTFTQHRTNSLSQTSFSKHVTQLVPELILNLA
jgi:hypothetical protein